LKVPHGSAPAMMAAEFGTKNVDILGVFGEDWKASLEETNPKTGTRYGDLFTTFLESVENLSFDDAKAHSIQLGINIDPKALFPKDTHRQRIYGMLMDTIETRHRAFDEAGDAFTPEAVTKRMKRLESGLTATDADPNASIPAIEQQSPHIPKPQYSAPNEDDINIKGIFSDDEIDLAEDARFVRGSRRSKIEKIFQIEMAKLEELGANVTPIEGGVLVENFPYDDATFGKLKIGKNFIKVNVAVDHSQLPADIRPTHGAYIVSIVDDGKNDLDPLEAASMERESALALGEAFDPVVEELKSSTDAFSPIASGGHYHGPTELLRKLSLSRQKLHLSDEQVANLKTKHAIFIPSTAANLESNASILQRLLESRIPLPFDRQVNENKVFAFAETLQDHFDPSNRKKGSTPILKQRIEVKEIAEAIQTLNTQLHTHGVRILDSGELLPGEVIPPSIQRHLKPYEAAVANIPSPTMFHTSASLTAMTNAFHHVLSPRDQGQAIAKIKSYDHLPEHPVYGKKAVEYTTAKQMYIEELASASHDITRPPEAQNDPDWTPLASSPHPVFHDFSTNGGDPTSPFMPVSKEERLARSFLQFIKVPNYAVDAVYPNFNYFLDDPSRHPGKNLQLNFEGQNPLGDHPDAIKINYGDISRPMLPPKLAKVLNAHFAQIKAHEDHKGNQKV